MSLRIEVPREESATFCKRWRISELALFGSVLRDDFHAGSDVDVLVRFAPQAHPTLFDLVRMQAELSRIFNRKVDLIERAAIEQSRNHLRRQAILQSVETIHAA